MRKFVSIFAYLCCIPVLAWGGEPQDFEKNWPQWRGPYANGVAPYANPPVKWDENNNIKWKIEIPGTGHATRIFDTHPLMVEQLADWLAQHLGAHVLVEGSTPDPPAKKH